MNADSPTPFPIDAGAELYGPLSKAAATAAGAASEMPSPLSEEFNDAHLRELIAADESIGTWCRDLITDELRVSPSMARMIGLPTTQCAIKSDDWRKMVSPETLRLFARKLQRAQQTGQPFDVEYEISTADGRHAWHSSRGYIVADNDGKPLRAVGISTDITDRKRIEEELRESEARFRLLSDMCPDGIMVYQDNCYVYANEAAARIWGVASAAELIGLSPLDVADPSMHAFIRARYAEVEAHGHAAPTEFVTPSLDGRHLHLQSTAGRVQWKGRAATQILIRDVSDLRDATHNLRVMSERVRLAIERTGEGVWDWHIPTNRYTLSGALRRLLGCNAGQFDESCIAWKELIHPDDYDRVAEALQSCLRRKDSVYQVEYRVRAADGSWRWVHSKGVVLERDESGRAVTMTGTMTDITARKEYDEIAWRQANLDLLTGLPNRRHFRDRLESEIRKSQRASSRLGLLFIDLDGFKQVNDLFGHGWGDRVLIEASTRIQHIVRTSDIVARLGGDEFTVLLTGMNMQDHSNQVCEKILRSLGSPFSVNEQEMYISASIGVAVHPDDASSADDLTRKADQAMYVAKACGKNQFHYFTQSMDDEAHARLRLINELRYALDDGQLELHFQPVINLLNGEVLKAEALLRWNHPRLGPISPGVFIPIAEEAGIIQSIGNWVFTEAVRHVKQWNHMLGRLFMVSLNTSPAQFSPKDMENTWVRHLQHQGVPGECIVVEITEGLLLPAGDRIANKLQEYRNAGIQIAIDDFGTGYSAMSYLHKFAFDYLKIDQSFVMGMFEHGNYCTIIETIIMMAHKLDLKVIAEGIQTSEQRNFLAAAGCDCGQGYLFSRPLSAVQMTAYLLATETHRNQPSGSLLH